MAAVQLLVMMKKSGKPLSELSSPVTKFPQRITNLRTDSKPALRTLKNLAKAQKDVAKTFGDRGRVNVRYSGTEPLLRIMVEAQDDATLDSITSRLTDAAKKDLGLK